MGEAKLPRGSKAPPITTLAEKWGKLRFPGGALLPQWPKKVFALYAPWYSR